jgi:hypothetical protein
MASGEVAWGKRSSSALRRAPSSALRKLRRAAAVSVSAATILRAAPPPGRVNLNPTYPSAPPSPYEQTAAKFETQRTDFDVPTISAGLFLGPSSDEHADELEPQRLIRKRDDFSEQLYSLTSLRSLERSSEISSSADVHILWRNYAVYETSVQYAAGVLYTSLLSCRLVRDELQESSDEPDPRTEDWHDCTE